MIQIIIFIRILKKVITKIINDDDETTNRLTFKINKPNINVSLNTSYNFLDSYSF